MDPRYPTGRFAYDPNPTAETRKAAIAAIAALPGELKAVLPAAQLDRPYREGGWTARQVVHHVADSHMNALIRMKLALTEDAPTIKPYDENAWALLGDARLPIDVSLAIIDGVHRRWDVLNQALQESDYGRLWTHPEHGKTFTIDWLLQNYGWHSRHHTAHVTALRARQNW